MATRTDDDRTLSTPLSTTTTRPIRTRSPSSPSPQHQLPPVSPLRRHRAYLSSPTRLASKKFAARIGATLYLTLSSHTSKLVHVEDVELFLSSSNHHRRRLRSPMLIASSSSRAFVCRILAASFLSEGLHKFLRWRRHCDTGGLCCFASVVPTSEGGIATQEDAAFTRNSGKGFRKLLNF